MFKQADIEEVLKSQFAAYPESEAQDMLKLIYQNEFGAGHLLTDLARAKNFLEQEYSGLQEFCGHILHENIGGGQARLHLRALKTGISLDTFFRIFEISASSLRGCEHGYLQKAEALKGLCIDGMLPFDAAEIDSIIKNWQAGGSRPFRHSEAYRQAYSPAYRVVDWQFCHYLDIFCGIDRMLGKKSSVTVAIDGDCASGKTTLAALLKQVYGCNVIHMDHFFLQPHQRNEARLAEVGGNVDYERFAQEALLPLKKGRGFSYRPFECQTQAYGQEITIVPDKLNVVEGVYALRPEFADAYDIKIFMNVGADEQMRRIFIRNGDEMAQRFKDEWIPMEKRYFIVFDVAAGCDHVVDNT